MRLDKTILQVIPSLDAGGAERTTLEMTRAIVESGGRAFVATSGGRLCAKAEQMGGRVIRLPLASKNPLVILINALRLGRIIKNHEVDLVHARSRAPAWSALWAARANNVPFVTTYHGAYRGGNALKRFYNSSMARGDIVIANSAFTAAAINRAYPVGDRLRTIVRGADIEEFNPSAISSERTRLLREKWGVETGTGTLVLLLPGRLTAWKGHAVAVEAMSEFVRERQGASGVFPPMQLIFAGDEEGRGDFARGLMRRVSELGLQNMIRWVGHCDDMPAAYSLADVVLAPSVRPEAFGRVAVEAGAMEKVAIVADHGGSQETVLDGETGLLTEPGSSSALRAAIEKAVVLGGNGRKEMGSRARRRVEEKFSTKAMTDATLAAYNELFERRTGNR